MSKQMKTETDPLCVIVSMPLYCPSCGKAHLDEGEWETRPHRTHLCLFCATEWRLTVRGYRPAEPEALEDAAREYLNYQSLLGQGLEIHLTTFARQQLRLQRQKIAEELREKHLCGVDDCDFGSCVTCDYIEKLAR